MHPEFQLREQHFLVIDVHDDVIKAGPADPFQPPELVIPNRIGWLKSELDPETPLNPRLGVTGSRLAAILHDPEQAALWHIESPIERGRCVHWDQLERIWHDLLFRDLRVKKHRNHSPVLLSLPSSWTRQDREQATKVFFEKFNVPGLYVAEQSLMALYGFGQHLTGMILNMAADRTEIIPIVDSMVLSHAMRVLPYGGQDLRDYLRKLLLADPHFKSHGAKMVLTENLLEHVESEVCEVSLTPLEQDSSKGKREKDISKQSFTYKDQQISVGDARLKAAELWFSPKLINASSNLTLPDAIFESLMDCDLDRRIAIISNVVVTGPYCRIKGLKARLEKELKRHFVGTDFCDEHQPKEVKYGRLPEYIEKIKGQSHLASFLGSAVVAKLVFPDSKNFITKLDYNEIGPRVSSIKGY